MYGPPKIFPTMTPTGTLNMKPDLIQYGKLHQKFPPLHPTEISEAHLQNQK